MIHTIAGSVFQTGGANTQLSSREGGREGSGIAGSNKGKFIEQISLRERKT